MSHRVYWLTNEQGETAYIGYSPDPVRRLAEHNSGKGARYTACFPRGSWSLHKVVSGFDTKNEALSFESRLQYKFRRCKYNAKRKLVLARLLGEYPHLSVEDM
jgi:predicted GIY-YIG superfamily endonuclease|eukprot:scaffold691_cov137-Isochrysis_galbana.AAC.3